MEARELVCDFESLSAPRQTVLAPTQIIDYILRNFKIAALIWCEGT